MKEQIEWQHGRGFVIVTSEKHEHSEERDTLNEHPK